MELRHYRGRVLMSALSFDAMYVLMYAMVDRLTNVYSSLNQAYMAALMTAPMVLIELAVMREMYRVRGANIAIFVASALAVAACFGFIRA